MPEVSIEIHFKCSDCGHNLKYEEIEVEGIFSIKPCEICLTNAQIETVKKAKEMIDKI